MCGKDRMASITPRVRNTLPRYSSPAVVRCTYPTAGTMVLAFMTIWLAQITNYGTDTKLILTGWDEREEQRRRCLLGHR
jgi:hypothetical protein